jgi:hypothetical protein
MSVNLSPVAGAAAQFLDNSGNVLTGGKLYTYLAGTTTPAATYTSSTGVTFHSNPIILDAAGRVPNGGEIWLSDNVSYKFVLKDSNDVLIGTWDNLVGINSNFVNYTSQEEIIVATAGQTVFNLSTVTYVPGTNSLQVYVDGVNQYDGITYAYVETDATTVTFTAGLHVGALVKFTTAVSVSAGTTNANLVIYDPAGTGAVTTTVQAKLRETVSIKDFGAVGDGVADDTLAIQDAADYCTTNGYALQGVPGTYLITATLNLNCNGDLSTMTVNADGTVFTPAIRVGLSTGSNYTSGINLSLPKLANIGHVAGDGWAGYDTNVGYSFDNLLQSIINVPSVNGFGIGIYVGGATAGNSYNEYTIQLATDSKVNLYLNRKSVSAWSNENTYYIGRCRQNSSESNSGVPFAGTRNISIGVANNNVLIRPCVEGSSTVTEYAIEMTNCAFNTLINPRWEGVDKFLIQSTGSQNTGNAIIGGYDFGALTYTVVGSPLGFTVFGNARGNQYLLSSGQGYTVNNNAGNGVTTPHFRGYSSAVQALGKVSTDTDYNYSLYALGLEGKRSTDVTSRIKLNWSTAGLVFGDGTVTPTVGFSHTSAAGLEYLYLVGSPAVFAPVVNNVTKLGAAGARWSEVFATNGTINTSDEREKQQVRTLSETEKAVAVKVKGLLKAFKFNDAVTQKGDKARIHFGVMAQDVAKAFESEGLDANDYSLFCYDKWEATPEVLDEDGTVVTPAKEAGDIYGIRYEELLAFVISAL